MGRPRKNPLPVEPMAKRDIVAAVYLSMIANGQVLPGRAELAMEAAAAYAKPLEKLYGLD